MKKVLAIIATLALAIFTTAAPKQQLTTKMLYHNGPLLTGIQNLYVIYYGCWTDNCGPTGDIRIREVLADFMISSATHRMHRSIQPIRTPLASLGPARSASAERSLMDPTTRTVLI